MGVPHGDDIMLNYQTSSYHDAQTLRLLYNKKPIKEFNDWLINMDIITPEGIPTDRFGDATIFLK